jgi:putative transposase
MQKKSNAWADHMHLCASIPPRLGISEFMGYLKGKPALMIFGGHPDYAGEWSRKSWARGRYASTVGNIDEERMKKYIQEAPSRWLQRGRKEKAASYRGR